MVDKKICSYGACMMAPTNGDFCFKHREVEARPFDQAVEKNLPTRNEEFAVEDNHLVRYVCPRRGKPYEHRCPRASFEQISHSVEEEGEKGFTIESLAKKEELPMTLVAITVAFLKERGMIDVKYRRNFSGCTFEDAMIEYLVLEKPLATWTQVPAEKQ